MLGIDKLDTHTVFKSIQNVYNNEYEIYKNVMYIIIRHEVFLFSKYTSK